MDMTSDLSLQESCMAELRHMGVEVRALIDKTNELEARNAELRALCKSMRCALALVNYEDKVYLVALDKSLVDAGFDLRKLGVEAK